MLGSDDMLFLVDGGGSGSRAELRTISGEIVGSAKGGAANISADTSTAIENLVALRNATYRTAKRDIKNVATDLAVLGLAGAAACSTEDKNELEHAMGFAQAHITTDIDITVAAALAENDGTVMMIGTGSCVARQVDGKIQRVGGWGFELGDECGGAWLGRELFRDALKAHDGIIPGTELSENVLNQFGGTPKKMVGFAKNATANDFAKFAPKIVAAFEAGDALAMRIQKRALNALYELLGPASAITGERLCFAGGLGPIYQNWVSTDYRQLVCPALGAPLDGAYLLAKRHLLG